MRSKLRMLEDLKICPVDHIEYEEKKRREEEEESVHIVVSATYNDGDNHNGI